MSSGFWLNADGVPLQFGTSKAVPDLGGDYVAYGSTREMETLISLSTLSFSSNSTVVPALPSSFSGTSTPIAAGIQSMTGIFPLQTVAPVTAGVASGGGMTFTQTQLWIDQVEVECLITANAGSGGATGLTGIGLAFINPVTQAFVQVTPNAGVQLLGSLTNAAMTAGATYTFRANANNTASTGGSGYIQYSTANTATINAGSWLGMVPLVTNAVTPLPTAGYVSTTAAGGTYSGNNAAGLLKLRVRYVMVGNIGY